MAINKKQCPSCGAKSTVKILYGEPTYEAYVESEKGELKLGGGCVSPDSPEYHCKNCGHEWTRKEAVDAAYDKILALNASVGGFHDGFYEACIHFESGSVAWKHIDERHETFLTQSEVKQLKEELKILNLLDWKSKYVEEGILDGTSWNVEIVREGRNLNRYGHQRFPEEWEAFCRLMSDVTGKRFS